MALGTVRLPKGLKADGKELPAGTYQVRLTADEAKPDAKGSSEVLERWVEFVQGGQGQGTRGRLDRPGQRGQARPEGHARRPSGGSKVETLKGGDYVRVWINKGGNYYLVHLPTGAVTATVEWRMSNAEPKARSAFARLAICHSRCAITSNCS